MIKQLFLFRKKLPHLWYHFDKNRLEMATTFVCAKCHCGSVPFGNSGYLVNTSENSFTFFTLHLTLTIFIFLCRNNLLFNVLVLKLFTPLFPYYFGAM